MGDLSSKLFNFGLKNKKLIITIFHVFYYLVLAVIVAEQYLYLSKRYYGQPVAELGIIAAETAIVIFILVGLPGIFRRFRIQNKIVSLIMLFRRQLGISVFMLSLAHYIFIRFTWPLDLTRYVIFELIGFVALCFLFLMFLTSNDWSVRHLGKWWTRIHYLFYAIAWLIFFHTALQEINRWSLAIGALAVAEVISYIYFFSTKPPVQQPVAPTTSTTVVQPTVQPVSSAQSQNVAEAEKVV